MWNTYNAQYSRFIYMIRINFTSVLKKKIAIYGHPKLMGHGGEFWQNVVHWRREWQPITVFLPWEPHKQYEKEKDMTLIEELPRSVGAQYVTGEEWRNNSRKNDKMEPKQNNSQLWMWLVMEVKSDAVKSNTA